MKKLLLVMTISLFSIAITEQVKSQIKHETKNVEKLTRDNLKDKNVKELNGLLHGVRQKVKNLNEEASKSIEEFNSLLKSNPDAMKNFNALNDQLNKKIGQIERKKKRLSAIAALISKLILEKSGEAGRLYKQPVKQGELKK